MKLKGTLVLLGLLAVATVGSAQFRNTKLGDIPANGQPGLSVAVNPKNTNNIVVVAGAETVFVTTDGGTSWNSNKIEAAAPTSDPTLITTEKGGFLYFHTGLNGSPEEGAAAPSQILLRRSDDGGQTWSPGEVVAGPQASDQYNQWLTIDPKGNLYATWTQRKGGTSDDDCQASVFFSSSKNGKKWSEPALVGDLTGECLRGHAMPTVTFDGKLMVTWLTGNRILLDRSYNGGEWWLSNDIFVTEHRSGNTLEIPGHASCNVMPVLASDLCTKSPYRGSLYIFWADQRNGDGDTDIWFTRSHNYGDNWSLPTRVNDDKGSTHQYMPWAAIDQTTGYIYVLYYDRRNYDDDRTDVYLAWSTDGGASFRNRIVSETPFTPDGSLLGGYNSISAHKGVIAPVWSRVDDGKITVWTSVIKYEDLAKK